MKIIIDNKIPFIKGVLEPFADVEYYPAKEITSKTVKDADALIVRTRTKCNADLLKGSKVKFIATATIGYDHIDTGYCLSKGIYWTNAPGCNSGSVMQYIASVFAFLSEKYEFDYRNKTLGIVGVGNVGSKVEKLASQLGFKVLLNDPPRERAEGKSKFVSLNEIQENADIITFHVPLIKSGEDKTLHLFNEEFVKSLKPDTIIINSSRGGAIDEKVLKRALTKKNVKAAVLDVWQNEPFIDKELLSLVDLGTSHIAGYSVDGKAMATAMSVKAISKFFNFGLTDWYPRNIPKPEKDVIIIDCNTLDLQSAVNKAIFKTYDVRNDDKILKSYPEGFENHRENYGIRREFGAYKIKFTNNNRSYKSFFNNLGFYTI